MVTNEDGTDETRLRYGHMRALDRLRACARNRHCRLLFSCVDDLPDHRRDSFVRGPLLSPSLSPGDRSWSARAFLSMRCHSFYVLAVADHLPLRRGKWNQWLNDSTASNGVAGSVSELSLAPPSLCCS